MVNNNVPSANVAELMALPAYRAKVTELMGAKEGAAFRSALLTMVASNPMLQQCQPLSVITAAMTAAQLHLPLNPQLGLAAVVPYGNSAQFQMTWKGYVQLAHRSGQFQTITVNEVYDGEILRYDRFHDEVEMGERVGGEVVGYLAYFLLKDGFHRHEYMTVAEVKAHAAAYSKSYRASGGPWAKNFDAMAKKTVLKRLLMRWAPVTADVATARTFDDAVVVETENGPVPSYVDNQPDTPAASTATIAAQAYPTADETTTVPASDESENPAEVVATSMAKNIAR